MSRLGASAKKLSLVVISATAASAVGAAVAAWTSSGPSAGPAPITTSKDPAIGTELDLGAFLVTADGAGHPGRIDAGDWLSVTFSEPLLASSLCATWSNDASVKTLTSGVTVAVANSGEGTSADVLSVIVPACGSDGFRFGTLHLGSQGYVGGGTTATFGATGTSSTLSWYPATSTLRVVLGSSTTSLSGTVPSSVAVYTPDAGVTDLAGLPITGTATSPGRQF